MLPALSQRRTVITLAPVVAALSTEAGAHGVPVPPRLAELQEPKPELATIPRPHVVAPHAQIQLFRIAQPLAHRLTAVGAHGAPALPPPAAFQGLKPEAAAIHLRPAVEPHVQAHPVSLAQEMIR